MAAWADKLKVLDRYVYDDSCYWLGAESNAMGSETLA